LTPIEAVGLTVFILVLFLGIFSILFGFPGTIIILLASIVYSLITGFEKIGLKIILILAGISLSAELLEFYLGSQGGCQVRSIESRHHGIPDRGCCGGCSDDTLSFRTGNTDRGFSGGICRNVHCGNHPPERPEAGHEGVLRGCRGQSCRCPGQGMLRAHHDCHCFIRPIFLKG